MRHQGITPNMTLPFLCSILTATVLAAAPAPTPTATAAPTPSVVLFGGITAVDQAASGPGTVLFTNVPLEPQTPYEFFTSVPGVTGSGVDAQLYVQAQYQSGRLRSGFLTGTETASGNTTNILYLGEPLMPTVNPFVSSRNMFFQTFLGTSDPVLLNRTSLLNGWIGARDGSWNVQGGWFLPQQTLSFVFSPPPLPNTVPQVSPQLPETLAPQLATLPDWTTQWPALPLQGIDASARTGKYNLEFFDGALPTRYYSSEFNNTARIASLNAALSASPGARFAIQVARVQQNMVGLTPIPAGVLYGGDSDTQLGPEGPEPESDVYGQRTTLVGMQAILHLRSDTVVAAEAGHSWFAAQFLSPPGQPTNAGYYHVGVNHSWASQELSADLYRFEPAYAPNVLPYGNFANLWLVAWAWPSPWLKSQYQLVANDDASINRQGFRVRYGGHDSHFSYRAGYADFVQVTPFNNTTAYQPGFTDPFFTSSQEASTSYRGTQRQFAGWLQWHTPGIATSLDFVDDIVQRPAPSAYPDQAIDMDVPQVELTVSHSSGNALYSLGEGRFAIHGCYACSISRVDIHQRVYFAGVNLRTGSTSGWLLEWRRYLTDGIPITGVPFSPAYTGTRVIVENRFRLQP